MIKNHAKLILWDILPTVDRVTEWADTCKYRKPRNANGSRAGYFYAYLCRKARG